MKKLLFTLGMSLLFVGGMMMSSCTKEGPTGPQGPAGTNGTNGVDGKDAVTTCGLCHNKDVVEMAATQFELAKHNYGEAAFEEAGNAACAPCHESEGFKYVIANNIPSTFTLNTTSGKYVNDYSATATTAYGDISCFTCHSSLHTTYGSSDLPALTTTAAVPMTMWAGAKTINLTQKGGSSNLCVRCHQPRPLTASAADGNVIDYAGLAANPTAMFYDPTSTSNKLKPGYRTHIHYGATAAIFAGMGGVEFTGTETYANSFHTANAACNDCHMAEMNGKAGGHTFVAKGNFKGCNISGCHTGLSAADAAHWTDPRAAVKTLLNTLASKLVINGVDILNRNPDATTNLWAGLTTNNYDGYLNIYDPINNPSGLTNNPGGTFQNPSPSSSWTQAQKDLNTNLPKISLTNAQMGAIINFQLCLRENSLGIHNTKYSKALLTNSIGKL